MRIKANGQVKLTYQLKCYTNKTTKSNKTNNKRNKNTKGILLKKLNSMNISFAQSARTECSIPLFNLFSKFPYTL